MANFTIEKNQIGTFSSVILLSTEYFQSNNYLVTFPNQISYVFSIYIANKKMLRYITQLIKENGDQIISNIPN